MSTYKKLTTIAAVAALAIGLAACGGGDDDTAMVTPPPPPPPTPYEMAVANIAAATTAADAQAAYDAVKDDVTASQGDALQAAVDARVAVLMTAARAAMQRAALTTAAGGVDTSSLTTQAEIDAAQDAIDALQAAIDAADDVDDTSMYESQVATAQGEVDDAQTALDTSEATMGRQATQRMALSTASMALSTARAALGGTPTQAQIDAVQNAVDALQAAIDGAMDLDHGDVHDYESEVTSANAQIAQAENTLADNDADAERERMEQEAAERAAMAATAAKLYAGIYAPAADATGTGTGDVHAAYNDAGTPTGSTADSHIMVTIGTGGDSPTAGTPVALSADGDTMVADHHGWKGARYIDPTGGDEYEAIVYSNVGEPTTGRMFGHADPGTGDGRKYEYDINANGVLTEEEADGPDATDNAFVAGRVKSPSFDQSAGKKEFELGQNMVAVMIAGSYHGVDGTYSCTPEADHTCSARVLGTGFTLGQTQDDDNSFEVGGGVWTFTPGNPRERVTDSPDNNYASYGWWIKKAVHNGPFTASAFVDVKGTVAAAEALDALNGTATYMGGAAGKYALASSTGGTNDAGHFTARATLEADFTNNTDAMAITGMIDEFIGADGMARDWSVKLNGSPITTTGGIGEAGDTTAGNAMTVWTIGGTASAAAGTWTGALYNNGDDGVPQVATGTFYSTYGHSLDTAGKMVGAFGANRQ